MSVAEELKHDQFDVEGCGPFTPQEIDPQLVVVAFLVRRISELPKESLQDLSDLAMQLGQCESRDDVRGITETFREILFPEEMIGRLRREPLPAQRSRTIEERKKWVGARIRRLRTQQGLNQDQLAERAGLPQSHISRLENGAHSPSFKTLEKIAKALGMAVRDLDSAED